jgi:hypothetical protein
MQRNNQFRCDESHIAAQDMNVVVFEVLQLSISMQGIVFVYVISPIKQDNFEVLQL